MGGATQDRAPGRRGRLAAAQGLGSEWNGAAQIARLDVDAVSSPDEAFWGSIPDAALHPSRVTIIEAMRWVETPLSPKDLVDVLDGDLSMWETAYHLDVLRGLEVVERVPFTPGRINMDRTFIEPYRLKVSEDADGG